MTERSFGNTFANFTIPATQVDLRIILNFSVLHFAGKHWSQSSWQHGRNAEKIC
jgi:hypothetical protein